MDLLLLLLPTIRLVVKNQSNEGFSGNFIFQQFKNNFHFDAIFISMINFFTAVYAGFAVFGILGFMAKNAEVPIAEVVSQGPGLSFITYPEVFFLEFLGL